MNFRGTWFVSRSGLFGLQCCQLEGQRQSGTQTTLPEMAAGIAEAVSQEQKSSSGSMKRTASAMRAIKRPAAKPKKKLASRTAGLKLQKPNPSRECPCLLLGLLLIKQMFYASDGEPESNLFQILQKARAIPRLM